MIWCGRSLGVAGGYAADGLGVREKHCPMLQYGPGHGSMCDSLLVGAARQLPIINLTRIRKTMNRVDRLFGILLQLQHRRRVRAQDLAAIFEVSERTVYRDMTALSEVGVPIIALPGEGYELMEGYYLRPLVFTPDEASALSLAAQMFMSQASGRVAAAAHLALAKLTAVLPAATRAARQCLTQDGRVRFAPDALQS